jgi:hypothetical protein
MSKEIKPNDAAILAENIVRIYRGEWKTYGQENELVKVIDVSGDVLIVEGKERFSVTRWQVK